MTIQECHVMIDLGLRKVNSARLGSLQAEEKDFVLNTIAKEYIKARRRVGANSSAEGYEDTKKRYDDLEEIARTATLPTYRRDDISVYSILPNDYFLLDKDHSNVVWNCGDITKASNNVNIPYCIVPIKTGGTTSPFYSNFKIEVNTIEHLVIVNTVLFDIKNYPAISSGLNTDEEKFLLVNLVLQEANKVKGGIEIWWENWNGIYSKGCFIVVLTTDPDWSPISVVATTNSTDTYAFVVHPVVTYTVTGNTRLSANRLTKKEDVIQAYDTPFRKTIPRSPISELEQKRLIVYHDKSFVINSTMVKYIKKPRLANLKLGYSLELNVDVHEEIVNLTVQRLKAILEGQNYKEIINENLSQE